MSETMLDIICKRAERICEDGVRLLGQFSGMHPINTQYSSIIVCNPNGDHRWNDMLPDGKRIQTKLLPEIDRFTELVYTISQNMPNDSQQNLSDLLKQIRNSVEQNCATCWKTNDEAVEGFRDLIEQLINTLQDYYGDSSDDVIAIPDTNAFLGNPDIEHWQFKDIKHFTIILTPIILSELDELKINHRNETVRDKAIKIIRKLKEYCRRGTIGESVVIVTGRISLKSIASEPNMSKSLSWLDPSNADDRFLATTLEVIRSNLGDRVFIITGDINLQNKAEMAGIPFCEVP